MKEKFVKYYCKNYGIYYFGGRINDGCGIDTMGIENKVMKLENRFFSFKVINKKIRITNEKFSENENENIFHYEDTSIHNYCKYPNTIMIPDI